MSGMASWIGRWATVALIAGALIGASDTAAAPAPDRKAAPAKNRKSPPVADRKKGCEPVNDPKQQLNPGDREQAAIPGMQNVRFFADSAAGFAQALPETPGPWLALSAGGEDGAYGAGVLKGWTASGTRPNFAVVTGISSGALMAVYAFAGPAYDEELGTNFTTVSSSDIFEVGLTCESLLDTWPLRELIKQRVTAKLLADVAAEHRRGRRLFVVTTNLDLGRLVVWNMGAIAAVGGDKALALFQTVLLASASIPGEFPPVFIEAAANSRSFKEMHVDGGLGGPFFVAPAAYLAPTSDKKLPATQIYLLVNGKLTPEVSPADRDTVSILGRSIGVALQLGSRTLISIIAAAASRSGVDFSVAAVSPDFAYDNRRGLFDPAYMKALYEQGLKQGTSGTAFRPALSALQQPSTSGEQGGLPEMRQSQP